MIRSRKRTETAPLALWTTATLSPLLKISSVAHMSSEIKLSPRAKRSLPARDLKQLKPNAKCKFLNLIYCICMLYRVADIVIWEMKRNS